MSRRHSWTQCVDDNIPDSKICLHVSMSVDVRFRTETKLDRSFRTWYLDISGPITPHRNLTKLWQKTPGSIVPTRLVSSDLRGYLGVYV